MPVGNPNGDRMSPATLLAKYLAHYRQIVPALASKLRDSTPCLPICE